MAKKLLLTKFQIGSAPQDGQGLRIAVTVSESQRIERDMMALEERKLAGDIYIREEEQPCGHLLIFYPRILCRLLFPLSQDLV